MSGLGLRGVGTIRQRRQAWCAVPVMIVALARTVEAHQGPPFPVVVDRDVGPYILSVWADPDIGTASFYVGIDRPPRISASDPAVAIVVRPKSARLPALSTAARPQRDGSYVAQVDLDRGDMWEVRVDVNGTTGAGHFEFETEATPAGYGRWDLLIYAGPFLLLGFLALAVGLRRRVLVAQ
jgi:hypothetical protein